LLIYLKAPSAETAHSQQAVISCLNPQFQFVQSQAAKTQGKFVVVQLLILIYHFLSLSRYLSNHSILFGVIHIATKKPSIFLSTISHF